MGKLKRIAKIKKGLYGLSLILMILLLPVGAVCAEEGAVELLAGTGEFMLEDGAPLKAGFRFPYGIAIDAKGDIILADSYNHAIRKLNDREVATIAGGSDATDAYGFPLGGHIDGNADAARFNQPRGVVIDSKGALYVSDTENHSIRKITNGKVLTLAGSGKAGYKNGRAQNAQFNYPTGMAIDAGDNIYVADTLNHCIRKITPAGEVSLYAGMPGAQGGYRDGSRTEAGFNEPAGLALDASGNLYVADSGNQVIRKIDAGRVSTFAGRFDALLEGTDYYQGGYRDGKKENALFNFPKGLTVTGNGTVIVADTWNHRIRAIKPDGEVITIGGTGKPGETVGPPAQAMFNGPVDVVYHSGYLYISDMWNNAVKRMKIDEAHLVQIHRDGMSEIQFEPVSEKIQVWVDGKKVNFPDVQPFMENGVVIVPLRFICETWGAEVSWKEETRQAIVRKGNREIAISPAEPPVFAKEGRTMVPAGYLAGNLGFSVEWVPEYRAVVIVTW